MALICLVAMVWFNPALAAIFAVMMLAGYLWFRLTASARAAAAVDAQLRVAS
ncbi:putative amino acid/amine transport protein [Cronobacter muytjensii 530]